ncbi:hypothetical protein FSP39_015679 [Pinctada imbricata]|uniref:Uncharacterized protein n=1 Tax=Pinctada imbricata TaxID=66713 RepID=A0AA88Y9K2_PINIB|nr:hypothetical protein FSP39_015679 [Pinctada imbricata]
MMTDRESDFSESNESRRTKVETRRSPAFQARRHGADESASSESESDYYHSDDGHYADFATDHSDEDGSQGEDDSRERFDPTVGDQIDKLTGGMRDYVYKHFTRHIKDEVIKEKIPKETPIPSNAVFTTPLMDDFVEELIDDKKAIMYTKIHDGSLKFVQKRIGHVMGPLSKIWKTVQKGVDGDESTSMGIDELLQLIEKTILLLGQANVACLYERRLNVLSNFFGDAKIARKSIFTNETLFIEGTQGKLLGEDYYKVLERHSKSRKRAREISDSLGKGKAPKRRKTGDERRSYGRNYRK